jgi:hypothetical protein
MQRECSTPIRSASLRCLSCHTWRLAAAAGSNTGDLKVHLGAETDFRSARKAHPAFIVANLHALVTRLQRAGHRAADDEPLEGFARVYVDDPFGNRIELMEPNS